MQWQRLSRGAGVTAILALAAWLRMRHLGLVTFHDDQAIALRIAHDILHGDIRTVGLASSSGASNPPLYVYIVAVLVAIHDSALFATGAVAVLSVVAIGLAYLVVRPRFGVEVALITIALFATAPWAVFFSRILFQAGPSAGRHGRVAVDLFVVLDGIAPGSHCSSLCSLPPPSR